MAQSSRAESAPEHSPALPPCPWCGYAGIAPEELHALGFLVCDACAGVSVLETAPPVEEDADDEWLDDTAEYDLVPSGPQTFRVERR